MPNLSIEMKISLFEVDRLCRQALQTLEMSENPNDERHIKFVKTISHFLHKDVDKFFLTTNQLKYLCDLANTNYLRYLYYTP